MKQKLPAMPSKRFWIRAFIGLVILLVLSIVGAVGYRAFLQHQVAEKLQIKSTRGIDEEQYVHIDGIDQWISIRGEDRKNPVLLVLHGGPGQPYSIFSSQLREWEKSFTVVQWDQPGAGKTFVKNGKAGTGTLTFDRLSRDGIEVTNYLRSHLNVQKVALLASSAGTIVAVPMVQQHPELFSAYIGSDQNVDVRQGNTYNYNLTLQRLEAAGKKSDADKLRQIGDDPNKWTSDSYTQRQQLIMGNDPVMKDVVSKVILPATLTAPGYAPWDVPTLLGGMQYSQEQLLHELAYTKISTYGEDFKVPVYIFQGESDILTPYSMAQSYFNELRAPQKTFVTIKNAGHLAMLTQPDQFLQQLREKVLPVIKAE